MNITTLLPLIRNAFSFAKFVLDGVHIVRPGKLGLSRLVHQLAGFYVLLVEINVTITAQSLMTWADIKHGKPKSLKLLYIAPFSSFLSMLSLTSILAQLPNQEQHFIWVTYVRFCYLYGLWHLMKDTILFTINHPYLPKTCHFMYRFVWTILFWTDTSWPLRAWRCLASRIWRL